MGIHQENHTKNKSSYAIGNVTFTTSISLNFKPRYYLYIFIFGDGTNSTIRSNTIDTNHTHNYTGICNPCHYKVIIIVVGILESRYCIFGKKISVISEWSLHCLVMYAHLCCCTEPVTSENSQIIINFRKKLFKQYPAKLQMDSDATYVREY